MSALTTVDTNALILLAGITLDGLVCGEYQQGASSHA